MIKKTLRYLSSVMSIVTLTACSGADLLNATIPANGYSVHKDVAYGSAHRQKLDIYVPEKTDPEGCTILFFYGGSWQTGSKEMYRFVGQALASIGCVTVIADYRTYPEIYYPVFVEDSALAFAWVHDKIASYGGNPGNLFLAGHSAGAYNAVMLALDPKYIEAAGGKMDQIRGVIGMAGPYNFLPFTDDEIIALFSTEKDEATQPITYAREEAPPMLLTTGDSDLEVYPRNTKSLSAKLRELGNDVTEKTYARTGHVGIILSLARGFRGGTTLLKDIQAFIEAHKVKN